MNDFSRECSLIAMCFAAFILFPLFLKADGSTLHHYTWEEGQADNAPGQFGILNNAGIYKSVNFSYNTTTQELSFEATFAPPQAPRELPQMLTIVVTPGYLPASSGNEAAIFYFDASGLSPRLTAYSMIPDPGDLDWETGSWLTGDSLCTSLKVNSCGGWIRNLAVTDNADGTRTFRFAVSTAAINAHTPSTPNPDGLPWTGAQFERELGIWIESFSYPNLESSYGTNGFLSALDHGCHPFSSPSCMFGSIEFQGYFDQDRLTTHQKPFCEDPAEEVIVLEPGQRYDAIIVGVSPDGDPLTVNYSGVPNGGTVSPPDGTQVPGSAPAQTVIASDFNWTPTEADRGQRETIIVTFTEPDGSVSCDIDIIVPSDGTTDCEGEIDQCGICDGDGTSCLGCNDVDILSTQFAMDGNAFLQFQNIRKFNRRLIRLTRRSDDFDDAKRFRRQTNQLAEELYLAAWVSTWSLESLQQQCTNEILCVSVSNVNQVETYVSRVDELFATARRVNRRIRQLTGRRSRKLLDAARLSLEDALLSAALIPASQSFCGGDIPIQPF